MFTLINVLTTTGLKNEELCTLKVKDVHYDSIGNHYYLDVLGKGNKHRDIPLRHKSLNSIEMFRYARGLQPLSFVDPISPLFTTNTGNPYSPSYLSQYITEGVMNMNLPFLKNRSNSIGPHSFRNVFPLLSLI